MRPVGDNRRHGYGQRYGDGHVRICDRSSLRVKALPIRDFLPQGQPERTSRVLRMVTAMDAEGFGNCTNTYECEAVCPAQISASFIAKLNREYAVASLRRKAGE